MIQLFVIFLYRPFVWLLKSVIPLFKSKMSSKLRAWFELRDETSSFDYSKTPNVFWFHASSGEIEYAKALIRELKIAKPSATIVVSYSSPSAIKLFENIKSHVERFVPLPWDQPSLVKDLVRRIHPAAIIFARTDLWPELIYQLKKAGVQSFIASYNPNLNTVNRIFSSIFLPHFKGIFCVHSTQASVLNSILPKTVVVSAPGDTRFDQVFWRLAQPSKISIPLNYSYGVLGSTWLEDEKIITPILNSILTQGYKLFWCPHEVGPENIERIELLLIELKINYKKYTELELDQSLILATEIILVDRVGILADLYRNATWAFIGGSFKSKVHSVMEPLCCAIPVITGPRIHNSPEAMKYNNVIMNELRVVQVANDSNEFLSAISALKDIQIKDFKKMLIGHLEQNRYASVRIVRIILDMFQETLNS